jgi:SAM-dependent methyltransferase
MIYDAINEPILSRVPKTAKRVLDLGCGSGALGRRLKEQSPCEVIGVTHSEAEAALASQYLDAVLLLNLRDFDQEETGEFDCIICSHVLEHLCEPTRLLARLRHHLSPEGALLVALPNVLHWRQRLAFVSGHFRYTDGGLMDRSHVRFFDWTTASALLVGAGYQVVEREASGRVPLSRFLGPFGRWLDRFALTALPGLFGWQFVFVCRNDRRESRVMSG